MGLLSVAENLSSFVTLASGIRDVIQAGSKLHASQDLKNLCGTFDFSSLSEELAPVADQVELYLARKKFDVLGDSLFSSKEKAEFIEDFFKAHIDTLPYMDDVEKILSNYIDQLESCLLQQMSTGEKVIYYTGHRIEEKVNQLQKGLDKLVAYRTTPPFAAPDAVSKIFYDIPNDYIPRRVVSHAVAMLDTFLRAFQEDQSVLLADALEVNNHLLLLSDAGQGKSIELQNLAGVLCETSQFPFLYSLSLYCREPVPTLLPESYRALPPKYLVLLFDGYDEMQANERDEFMRRLQSFIKEYPSVKIVISSRSNFCNAEIENQSQTFRGFQVYDLDDLTDADIRDYLSSQSVDVASFIAAANQAGTEYLLQNPFYLTRLVRLYQKNRQLPGKADVMDYLVKESFQLDDQKFQESLEEHRRDLFILLEKAAFAMQLMQKPALEDVTEYQELFTWEERSLLKHSGLLRKEGTCWRFVHNNFKEYLAARFLSALPQDEAIRYFSDGQDIKMSWVNTFGFFASMKQTWDLKAWILEHIPSALVKFEPEHLEPDVRAGIFKAIFLEREKAMLWISNSLYTLEQLAAFACCEETLEFLLDKISCPVHRTSQICAINLIQHVPRLFGRRDETSRTLLSCCMSPVDGNEGLCYNALEALSKLRLVTSEIAAELVAKYKDCSDVHVRWGMYQLLTHSGQHNVHVQFFLDGIAYTHGNNRIANETIALVDGLKALFEPESIQIALQFLAQARPMTIYEEDEVYEVLCEKAAEQFSQGETAYYRTLVNSYIYSSKHCSHRKMHATAHFFEATNTIERAVIDLCNAVDRYFDLDALFCHSDHLAYAANAYRDGRLKNHTIFHELVERHAHDAEYRYYKDLVLQIDGITLPERKAHIDYERLKQERKQEYFDILFDRARAEELLLRSIQKLRLPDPTVNELIWSAGEYEYGSLLMELNYGLHRHVQKSVKAKNALQALDWNQFVIFEAYLSVQNEKTIQVSDKQKSALREMLSLLYGQNLLENAVTYRDTSAQVPIFVIAAVSLSVYLGLVPEENMLLQMTELPYYCFSQKEDAQKYIFLESHISKEPLRHRIIENVKAQRVHGLVLRDHIQYCAEHDCEDIREAAVEAVKMDESARTAAIEYLYKVFGAHCIQKELLPFADERTLLDIERLCPNLSKEHLRIAMERQFRVKSSLKLMTHLIVLESETALCEYIRLARENHTIPEHKNNFLNGPTEAISSLRNPELLPLLEDLMNIALSPDFQEEEFCSLRSSLSNALVACGSIEPETVMAILQSHQGTPERNKFAFRFCSYTADMIKQKNRVKWDAPWKMCDVKHELEVIL